MIFFFLHVVLLLPFGLVAMAKRATKIERARNVGVNTQKYQLYVSREWERYFYVDLPGRFGTQKTVSNFQLKCAVSLRMKQPHTKENGRKKRTELNGMELICDGVHIRHFTYLVIAFSHPFLLFNSFYVILTIIEHSSRLNM